MADASIRSMKTVYSERKKPTKRFEEGMILRLGDEALRPQRVRSTGAQIDLRVIVTGNELGVLYNQISGLVVDLEYDLMGEGWVVDETPRKPLLFAEKSCIGPSRARREEICERLNIIMEE